MSYRIDTTTQFKRDLKLAKKQGKDISKLWAVVRKLADGYILEERFRDHALTGELAGFRDCHIEPDWLLVYKKQDDILVLILNRVGSHTELFD